MPFRLTSGMQGVCKISGVALSAGRKGRGSDVAGEASGPGSSLVGRVGQHPSQTGRHRGRHIAQQVIRAYVVKRKNLYPLPSLDVEKDSYSRISEFLCKTTELSSLWWNLSNFRFGVNKSSSGFVP